MPSQMARLLERDRERFGITVGQVGYRLGLTPAQYRAFLEDPRWMTFDTWQRICDLYGYPQTFASTSGKVGRGWDRT